jgi:CRP-like cAMP-binding protein
MNMEFLKKVNIFKQLTNEELRIINDFLKPEKFKKNEQIISEEETGNCLYILYLGEVEVSRRISMIDDQENIDKTFIVFKSENAESFGETGILGRKKRTATCKALSDCLLYSLSNKDFFKISKMHPQIGMKIMMEITNQLAALLERTNQDVLKLTTALIYALK